MADDLSKRLAGLSPEQRELLLRRLKKKGLESVVPASAPPSVHPGSPVSEPEPPPSDRPIRFSLFFFSDGGTKEARASYDLLLESARFGDRHGFAAVWTPERHFGDFGGLYPNPAVLSARLAVATERIAIRAGSVVLPLHHPVRIAEEWAVVDNLSRGRVGVSFASGWHPTDFALAPEGFNDRKELMFQGIETVRRLWRGETVRIPGVDGREVEVRTLPRPVQPDLPIWVTASGSTVTWTRAGEIGANILTIVQPLPLLADRIARYRAARAAQGLDPEAGQVAVMLHTFVGNDDGEVKEKVRHPMREYLRNYLDQYGPMADAEAVNVREEDVDTVLDMAFENYFANLSLLGTVDKCTRTIDRLRAIGVDEAACLIDFGAEPGEILSALPFLDRLQQQYSEIAVATSRLREKPDA